MVAGVLGEEVAKPSYCARGSFVAVDCQFELCNEEERRLLTLQLER